MPAAQPDSSQRSRFGYPGAGTAGAIPTSSKPSRIASALIPSVSAWRDIAVVQSRDQGSLETGRVLDAEVLVDCAGRIRAVERVEMDAPDLVIEQVAALLGGPVDSDLGNPSWVVAASPDGPEQPGREPRPQRQLRHPCQIFL